MKNYPYFPILMVDDEQMTLKSFEITLKSAGYRNLLSCSKPREVIPLLKEKKVYTILLDLNMPDISGQELLNHIILNYPEVPVIVITGNDQIDTAVQCMKLGAFDYILKPVEKGRLISGVRRAVDIRELKHENYQLKQRVLGAELSCPEAFSKIITSSKDMKAIFQYAESIAQSPQPVLISGETGVGKELMAKAVHKASKREGKCVFVNVAGIDDNAFTDTLFGHIRGAYTGADQSRPGLVEKAAGGSLVLDEIGDLDISSQIKLLRLIQEGEYFPLGSDVVKAADTRVIVCTNIDLLEAQQKGTFRKDLYFRLRSHRIELPPLRNRREDIILLLTHFLDEASLALGKNRLTYPEQLLDLLMNYHFPGNIRELKAMVYDAVSTVKGKTLSLTSFEKDVLQSSSDAPSSKTLTETGDNQPIQFNGPLPTLKAMHSYLIAEAMHRTNNNQSMAARMLGISRQTLARHLPKE